MPLLRKFMCCCQLNTGAVIIGWSGLVLDVISLAANSAILDSQINVFKVPLGIVLACNVISIIANTMLLWGTNAKNSLFLLPWLTVTMMIIVCFSVTILTFGTMLSIYGHAGAAAVFILGILFTGILVYMWIGILSLFQELRDEDSLNNENCTLGQRVQFEPFPLA